MSTPIVANSNISTQCTFHFLLLIFWSVFLLPAGVAKDSIKLLSLTSLTAFIALIIYWSSPIPIKVHISSSASQTSSSMLDIPLYLAHCLPETVYVGIMITCILARICSPPCPSPKKMCSRTTKWSSVMFAAIVFPLIALNHMSGSCGGKIVVSYKKGYEVFSEVSDDLCSAHFSYLTLSGAAFVTGCAWHFVAESSWWSTTVVRGLENIFLCVVGLVLVVFRAVTVATFVGNGNSNGVAGSTSNVVSGDAFFSNAGKLQDGIIWGNIMGASVCWIVVGFIGVCCVMTEKCRWFANLSVIISLIALGAALLRTGSFTSNTYFGTLNEHHDPILGVMQSTCLLTAGLLTWLIVFLRILSICVEKMGSSTGIPYYSHSVCGIAATAIGGFILAAQPAMTQMLSRDLNMDCFGVSCIVLMSSITLHIIMRGLVSSATNTNSAAVIKTPKRNSGGPTTSNARVIMSS